ncbi:MAG: phosphatidylglycerol lysyltransferase domain-containing protein, partial [Chloroflexota bacterium]
QLPQGFVLQSCNVALRDYLIEQGCQAAPMGAEAILDLPWRGKRSVRELARRGRRHGTIREVKFSRGNQNKLAQLMRQSPSRQGTQLKHTERSAFDETTRCFVFETAEQKWVGAITLSTVATNYAHTELLLRHKDAPVGIMEALVTAITQQLEKEGVEHLSLGNVTPLPIEENEKIFAAHRHPKELWERSQMMFRLGRAFNFAYNADGLWKFKNKFSPRWEPLYLCASPRLSWITVAGLMQAMGYNDLVWEQLLQAWPISIPTLQLPFPQVLTRLHFRM